jgi:DNA-directed RNA polymerase subunit RPC12/RpoP
MRNDGTDFEKRSADRLSELGWECSHTPTSGDFGADLICKCGNETLIVQCKDYSEGNSIGVAAVQETITAKLHFKADVALLLFQGRVTQQGQKLAKSVGVELAHISDLCSGWVLDRTEKGKRVRKQRELDQIRQKNEEQKKIDLSKVKDQRDNEFKVYSGNLSNYVHWRRSSPIMGWMLISFTTLSALFIILIPPIGMFMGAVTFVLFLLTLSDRKEVPEPMAPKWMTESQVREIYRSLGIDYQRHQKGELSQQPSPLPSPLPLPSSPIRSATPSSPPSPLPPSNNTQRGYTKIGTTDSCVASTPDVWKCLRCSKNLNLKHKIGTFQIKCPSCHASYLYDRVSHKSPPTIYEKW